LAVQVVNNPPSQVAFVNNNYTHFHCGEWKVCSYGEFEVTNPGGQIAESYTWYITPPWYFQTASGPQQTVIVGSNFQASRMSPIVKRQGNGSAQLSVYGSNCKGAAPQTTITLVPEDPGWCPPQSHFSFYPAGCVCCLPPDDGTFFKQQDQTTDFAVYPNPSIGLFTVSLPSDVTDAQLAIYSASGQLVYTQELSAPITEIKTSNLSSGVYQVHITSQVKSYVQQLIITGYGE
jgi:hypothetical protein